MFTPPLMAALLVSACLLPAAHAQQSPGAGVEPTAAPVELASIVPAEITPSEGHEAVETVPAETVPAETVPAETAPVKRARVSRAASKNLAPKTVNKLRKLCWKDGILDVCP